jgi:hypothetical protein
MPRSYDPASEGAQMSFDGRMSYGDYLKIDTILGALSTADAGCGVVSRIVECANPSVRPVKISTRL